MEMFASLYAFLFNGISKVVDDMEVSARNYTDKQYRADLERYITAFRQLQLDAEQKYIEQ